MLGAIVRVGGEEGEARGVTVGGLQVSASTWCAPEEAMYSVVSAASLAMPTGPLSATPAAYVLTLAVKTLTRRTRLPQ